MSTTPCELLDWAKAQQLNNEASCRACVSRAYYAAFHDCGIFQCALPSPGAGSAKGGMHENICHQLQNPAPEASEEQRKKSKLRGAMLRALKHVRVTADYGLDQEVSAVDANNATAKAEVIMNI